MSHSHRARTSLTTPDAERLGRRLATHLAGHGAALTDLPRGWVLDFGHRRAEIAAGPDRLDLLAEAGDGSLLHEMQLDLAEHLAEFAGPQRLDWLGPQPRPDPPNFRLMTVEAVTQLTPRMIRLRLSGPELLRFDTASALHCKLLIPPRGTAPVWPSLDADGRFRPGNGLVRKYTIRALDAARGWMDIDFVTHHPAGPGSDWAMRARVGERLGLIGPGGGGIRRDGPLLLLGDETALPAIARTLEALPPDLPATALIEIADEAERQPIALSQAARVVWLPRDGAPHGEELVAAFLRQAPSPDTLVWAGCEFAAFRAIRSHLRGPLSHPRERHLITAYWRKGISA